MAGGYGGRKSVDHVLLISVDGMHQSDLAWYVQTQAGWIAQYGVVYTGNMSKTAERCGDHPDDRNVPILVAWPGAFGGTAVTASVKTTQIAPTILELLGLDPDELQAVRTGGTQPLF